MADELIKTEDSSYAKYEKLLIRRDEVRKEAFQYEREYVRVFGDLILKVFEKKIECIRKKKTIEYCQIFINRGEVIDQAALQEHLQKELEAYEEQLKKMIQDNESAKQVTLVPEANLLKIKKIYRRLVKKIHPDMNPALKENDELASLWQRLIIAYNCNDLKEMEETEVLVTAVLDRLGMDTEDCVIPDIKEKIAEIEAEIEKIIETDPYQYKYLLGDPELVREKKDDLKKELNEYEDYSNQLEEILQGYLEGGMKILWRMN